MVQPNSPAAMTPERQGGDPISDLAHDSYEVFNNDSASSDNKNSHLPKQSGAVAVSVHTPLTVAVSVHAEQLVETHG